MVWKGPKLIFMILDFFSMATSLNSSIYFTMFSNNLWVLRKNGSFQYFLTRNMADLSIVYRGGSRNQKKGGLPHPMS